MKCPYVGNSMYVVLVLSQGESLITSILVYMVYIHHIYIIAIIRERNRINIRKGKKYLSDNDVFARFGRDEDKVTFSCLSGITKVSHIQKQLT